MKWINFLNINEVLYPEKIALIDQKNKKRYSYKDLSFHSNSWAMFLEDRGIKKGDRIALLAPNRFEHIVLLFAAAKVGAVLVPLNFRLAEKELETILEKIDAKILFGEGDLELKYSNSYIDLNSFDYKSLRKKAELQIDLTLRFDGCSSNYEDDILMQFTSGTTGEPKGVLMHGEMLKTNQEETCSNWELSSDDITMVETPFFHTGGYNVLCLPLLELGGTIILAEKFDVSNVLKTIQEEKVSVYFGVPTMFQMISEHDNFDASIFKSIRFFVSGGAACPVELIDKYQKMNISFKQGFGLTEVGPNCFLLKPEDAKRKIGSVGKPMAHSKVKVKTIEGYEAKVGEVGELHLKGAHLCHGYYKDEKTFKLSLEDGYFKTGDLVRFDEEGFYYIVGRKKDMYISGGENVYPGEVERSLLRISGIKDAVVVSVPCSKWGEVGHAFLKVENDIMSKDAVRGKLNGSLSRYKQPHFVECLNEFPLLENGKINRIKLKEIANISRG